MPIPEESSYKESSSIAAGKEELKKIKTEEPTYKKEPLRTHPEGGDQIAVKINKKSNVLIRGRSSEVIRVANILRQAI